MSNKSNTPKAKRGRPVVNGSKRQAVLAMREAKRAQGIEIKRGRPAGTKKTETVVKAPKAKASKADKQAKLRTVTNDIVTVDFNPELTHESLQVL